MKRTTITATLCLAAAALLLGLRAGAPPANEPRPLVSLSGSYSAVEKPRVEVIGDVARWAQVWREHKGDKLEKTATGFPVIPGVDFERCMVVAMFSGASSNGSGWHIVSQQQREGHTLIRYQSDMFQSMSTGGDDKGFDTTAYGIAFLDRSALPLILEENVQSMIDGPPVWKERLRLPALRGVPASAP